MMWWDHSGWAWLWMSIVMISFWAVIAVGIMVLVRNLGSPTERRPSTFHTLRSPEDILAERYALGEIDAEEYRQRSEDIATRARGRTSTSES